MVNFKPGEYMREMFIQSVTQVACEQALSDALAAGREKEGKLATTSLEFPPHIPLWLSVDGAIRCPHISAKRKRARK